MGLFDSVKKIWSQDMAIDLGTANTLVVLKVNKAYLKNFRCIFRKRSKLFALSNIHPFIHYILFYIQTHNFTISYIEGVMV